MKKSTQPFCGQTQPLISSKLSALLRPGIAITGFLAMALAASTASAQNTSYGSGALSSITTGTNNSAFGADALHSNTTGTNNTATGFRSLYVNTIGNNNTATGAYTLTYSTGEFNTATGQGAMFGRSSGGYNTATGGVAMYYNTTGDYNTADGFQALNFNTMGVRNTASGVAALRDNTTGDCNTASGLKALLANITGSYNTALGYYADVIASNQTNSTAIGFGAIADASNKVRIGNTSVTSIGGQVGWTTFSDGRYKKEIKEDVVGLAFINSLRPVTYTVNVAGLNQYFNKDRKRAQELKYDKTGEDSAVTKVAEEASKIVYDGFIAQEVEAAANKLGIPFSGVDKPKSKDGLYGLRYDNFVVPLVKSVQELSKQNDEKEAKIDALQKQIDELKALVLAKNGNSTGAASTTSVVLSAATLEQNTPNPFDGTTIIPYTLPQSYTNARVVITDQSGRVLNQVSVSGAGKGTLKVDAGTLAAGAYNYSLVVDGQVIGSKRMVVVK